MALDLTDQKPCRITTEVLLLWCLLTFLYRIQSFKNRERNVPPINCVLLHIDMLSLLTGKLFKCIIKYVSAEKIIYGTVYVSIVSSFLGESVSIC